MFKNKYVLFVSTSMLAVAVISASGMGEKGSASDYGSEVLPLPLRGILKAIPGQVYELPIGQVDPLGKKTVQWAEAVRVEKYRLDGLAQDRIGSQDEKLKSNVEVEAFVSEGEPVVGDLSLVEKPYKNVRRQVQRDDERLVKKLNVLKLRFEEDFRRVDEYVMGAEVNLEALLSYIRLKNESLEAYKSFYISVYPDRIDFYEQASQWYLDIPGKVAEDAEDAGFFVPDFERELEEHKGTYKKMMEKTKIAGSSKEYKELEELMRNLKAEIKELQSAIPSMKRIAKVIAVELKMRDFELNGELIE